MTMPQHEARERFLIDHINHGTSLLMRSLATANEHLDSLIDHEDDAIALRQQGDAEGALRADAMAADARAKHANMTRWADTLSEQLGAALLRLATGREDV